MEEEARVGGSARPRRIVESPADLADEPVRRRELLHSARLAAVYRAHGGLSSSRRVRGLRAGAGTGHASVLGRRAGGFPLGVPDEGDVRQPPLAGELVLDQVEGDDVTLAQARTRFRQVLPRKLVQKNLLRSEGGRQKSRRPLVAVVFVVVVVRLFRRFRSLRLSRHGDSPSVGVQFGAPAERAFDRPPHVPRDNVRLAVLRGERRDVQRVGLAVAVAGARTGRRVARHELHLVARAQRRDAAAAHLRGVEEELGAGTALEPLDEPEGVAQGDDDAVFPLAVIAAASGSVEWAPPEPPIAIAPIVVAARAVAEPIARSIVPAVVLAPRASRGGTRARGRRPTGVVARVRGHVVAHRVARDDVLAEAKNEVSSAFGGPRDDRRVVRETRVAVRRGRKLGLPVANESRRSGRFLRAVRPFVDGMPRVELCRVPRSRRRLGSAENNLKAGHCRNCVENSRLWCGQNHEFYDSASSRRFPRIA